MTFSRHLEPRAILLGLILVATVSACGSTVGSLTPEQQAMKPACVAGDMSVCAEIGHQVAAQRAGG